MKISQLPAVNFILVLLLATVTYSYNCYIDSYCSPCINMTHCQQCNTSRYGLNFGITGQVSCGACSVPNCRLCFTNAGQCEKCDPTYGVANPSTNNYSCIACPIANCLLCSENANICDECSRVLRVGLFNNTCIPCADPNCYICSLDHTFCTRCDNYYGPAMNGSCIPCTVHHPNCMHCWANSSFCDECSPQFGASGGACYSCSLANCHLCTRDPTTCAECDTHYGYDSTNRCFPCDDSDCVDCLGDYQTCVLCEPGFGISIFTCNPCTSGHCTDCFASYSNCVQCEPGYGTINGAAMCQLCIPTCLTCQFANKNYCVTCYNGSYLVGTSCTPCPSGCALCSNGTICQQCHVGYFINAFTTCGVCPANCTDCFLNVTEAQPQCTNCSAGFELDNQVPVTCRELCGDGVTAVHPCDNQLDEPYDGCSNDCETEPDFECSVVANLTSCSYNGTLQMSLLQVRQERGTNRFVLEVKVFPPLHAFKVSSPQELQTIFLLNTPGLTVTSVTYDAATQALKFEGELTSTLKQGDSIEILFVPSLSSSAVYSASVEATLTITLPKTLHFASSFTLGLAKALSLVCYALSALGWVGCLLGAVLRRLAGLEAFVVQQFSWLTLMWVRSELFVLFEQVLPLRYTAGYNFAFLSQQQAESASAPYLSQFGISAAYFANNCSFPLLVMLVFLVAVLVTTVRERRYFRQCEQQRMAEMRKTTEQTVNTEQVTPNNNESKETDEERQQHAQKLMEQNELAYTLLMYWAMAFLVYFAFCSAVFFSYGSLTNLPSQLLFDLTLLVIIFTLVQFARDPASFDYFRFSFRPTSLAMNHYFVHVLVLLAATLLLVLLPAYSWSGLAALLLMLLFTLAYRPYKELAENLRSAFNYATMSSFLGFLLYVQMVPSSSLGSDTTTLFLLVNVAVLLPLVVIFGLVSSAYYFYYEHFVLPREELAQQQTKDGVVRGRRRKVLRELAMISARTQMQAVAVDTTFRQLVSPQDNLKNTSDALRDEFLREERLRLEAEKQQNPLDRAVIREGKNSEYSRYKQIMKMQMIHPAKQTKEKDDGIVRGFDGINEKQTAKVYSKQSQIGQLQQQLPTQQQIAKKFLITQNKFVNLRGALEYIRQDMSRPIDKNADKFMQEFDKIML